MKGITKRKDGRYQKNVYVTNENGKPIYKTVSAKTKTELEKKYVETMTKINRGQNVLMENEKFSTFAEIWLEQKKISVSDSCYKPYLSAVSYLVESFGDVPISKVNTADIQKIINDLAVRNPHTFKPTSKRTLKLIVQCSSNIFKLAIKNRILTYNPADYIELPNNAPKRKVSALNEEQRKWIVETPHRAQTAAMLMMYAGLRRGELLALTWNDIDLINSLITVNKTLVRVNNEDVVKLSPKTEAGIRTIPIPDILRRYLAGVEKDSLYPVHISDGRMMNFSNFRKMWKSYMFDLNLKYGEFSEVVKKFMPERIPTVIETFNPHQLRHTYATILYTAGVDVLTASALLGHADVDTTLKIYTDLDSRKKESSIDKLNQFLNA